MPKPCRERAGASPVRTTGRPARRRRIGRRLTAAGLILGAWSGLAPLLPWDVGVWPDVEGTNLAVHAAAIIVAIGLWIHPAAARLILTPLAAVPLAIGTWSTVSAAFARYPLLAVTGAPQTAEGTALWFAVAVFIAGGLLVRRHAPTLRTTAVSAIGAALAVPLLNLHWQVGPANFDDFLAFYGLGAAVIAAASARAGALGRLMQQPALAWAVGIAAAIPGLAVSGNRSALVLVGLGILATASVACWLSLQSSQRAVWLARATAAAATLAAAIALPVATTRLGESLAIASVQSRDALRTLMMAGPGDEPLRLVVGHGWGHTAHLFGEWLPATSATIWDRSWDAAWREIFHSHDAVLEAMLAAGIPAAIGVLALPVVAMWIAPRRRLALAAGFSIAVAGLWAQWFQLAATVPLVALALAMLPAQRKPMFIRRVPMPVATAVLGICILLQSAAVWLTADYAVRLATFRNAPVERFGETGECGSVPLDTWRGDLALTRLFSLTYAHATQSGAYDEKITRTYLPRLPALLCAVDRRALEAGSPPPLRAALVFRAGLAFDPELAQALPEFAAVLDDWDNLAHALLRYSPTRSDLLVPYLARLLERGELEPAMALLRPLRAGNPQDPVALWFEGLVLLGSGDDRARAGELLRRALAGGIERWLPIPQESKDAIEGLR